MDCCVVVVESVACAGDEPVGLAGHLLLQLPVRAPRRLALRLQPRVQQRRVSDSGSWPRAHACRGDSCEHCAACRCAN